MTPLLIARRQYKANKNQDSGADGPDLEPVALNLEERGRYLGGASRFGTRCARAESTRRWECAKEGRKLHGGIIARRVRAGFWGSAICDWKVPSYVADKKQKRNLNRTKDCVEGCAFPPLRQEKGARTGHGAVSSIASRRRRWMTQGRSGCDSPLELANAAGGWPQARVSCPLLTRRGNAPCRSSCGRMLRLPDRADRSRSSALCPPGH